ncbi:MAG: acyl-CoA dehydrogenase, partial [Caulobacteraceae bacterium]
MDLALGPTYEAFRDEVRGFLVANRDRFPSPGAGRAGALAWQALLIEHGYAARTIPQAYGGFGAE